ncbi:MAG: hypothetical protein KDA80_08220 [Planctomycetaceae bacterium]|nr:hypothetical protein [Planctomycetaceae bacterium]
MGDEQKHEEKLVVLATFPHDSEAYCLVAELENRGIRACVANEKSTAVLGSSPYGGLSSFWIEVLVLESDALEALAIKHRLFPEGQRGTTPEWVCECGETVDAGFEICWSCSASCPSIKDPNDANGCRDQLE